VNPPSEENNDARQRLLRGALRLNSGAIGFACGILCGGVLFLSTIWLVLKGGKAVGPHLALLSHFLPGYSVSVVGSIAGLLYGFAIGTMGGCAVGWIYNRIVDIQQRLGKRDD
jgi:hypothetical protein